MILPCLNPSLVSLYTWNRTQVISWLVRTYMNRPCPFCNYISYHCPLTFCYLDSLSFCSSNIPLLDFVVFCFSIWNSLSFLIFAWSMYYHQSSLSTNTMSLEWSPLTTPILSPTTLLYFLLSSNFSLKYSFLFVYL